MSIIITIIIPNIGTSPDYSPLIIGHIIPTMVTIIPMIFHDYPNSMNSIKIPIGYINRLIWLQYFMWGFMEINHGSIISGLTISHYFRLGNNIDFRYTSHTHIYICIYVCIYIIIILSHNLFPTVFPNDLFPVIMIIQYYPIIFPGSSAPDGCGVTSHPNLAPLAALEMLFSTIGWILKDNVLKNSMGILWDI